jgi:hypothetical protein
MIKNNNINTCAWIGQGEGCSLECLPGKSYCAHHYEQVYQKGTALRKRHKDLRVANSVWDIEQLMHEAVEQLIEEGFDL